MARLKSMGSVLGRVEWRKYFRDAHVYGGILLLGVSGWGAYGWPIGLGVVAVILLYLGIRGI